MDTFILFIFLKYTQGTVVVWSHLHLPVKSAQINHKVVYSISVHFNMYAIQYNVESVNYGRSLCFSGYSCLVDTKTYLHDKTEILLKVALILIYLCINENPLWPKEVIYFDEIMMISTLY
jgi:hypothetical protein